jgi:hypothetical protein
MIGLRASPDLRQQIERWAASRADKPSLSEAIRQLVEFGLSAVPARKPSVRCAQRRDIRSRHGLARR